MFYSAMMQHLLIFRRYKQSCLFALNGEPKAMGQDSYPITTLHSRTYGTWFLIPRIRLQSTKNEALPWLGKDVSQRQNH